MKQLHCLVVLLGLCTCGASAQTTLTTYYVIPPSNGCDGVWAFGPYSALWSACSGPYTWTFDPFDCVDGSQWGQPVPLNVVGDTIIMDLCSQPCDFLFYADTGLCAVCYGGPLIPTGLPGQEADPSISIGPNPLPVGSPLLTLNTNATSAQHVQVLDLDGRSLLRTTISGGRSRLDLSGLPVGGYLLLVQDESGKMIAQRITIQ